MFGGGQASEDVQAQARELGEAVARRGWVLVNGGREAEVLDAVEAGARELASIAEEAYRDEPEAPEQLAQASTRAHLAKLVDEGRVQTTGEGWEPA